MFGFELLEFAGVSLNVGAQVVDLLTERQETTEAEIAPPEAGDVQGVATALPCACRRRTSCSLSARRSMKVEPASWVLKRTVVVDRKWVSECLRSKATS